MNRSATYGNMNMTENSTKPGDLDRDVMQLIWASGPMTFEAVRERLSLPL
jgi:BlaI family transcriptional regulator, penicillinase repressor